MEGEFSLTTSDRPTYSVCPEMYVLIYVTLSLDMIC